MAKKNPPTKKELLAAAITKNVEGSVEQTVTSTFLPNRTENIGTSIPAKYNPKTGKVVLMDVIQHSEECAKLIKKGVVPLLAGYVYVNEKGYNTLKARGLLDSTTGDWKIDKKTFKTVANAPNAQMGFTDVEEAAKLSTKRNDTEFAIQVKKDKTYWKVIPLIWRGIENLTFEQIDGNLVYEALLIYIQNTVFKSSNPVTVHLYFTSSPLLKLLPYPDSKLFSILIKSTVSKEPIDITNVEIVSFDEYNSKEYEALSVVSRDVFDKQGAGHLTAIKTAEAQDLVDKAEELYIDPKFLDNNSQEIMDTLKIYISLLKEDLEELKNIDRVFGSTAAYFHKDLETNYANIVAGANQLGLGIYFNIVNKKGLLKSIKAPAFIEMLCKIDGISTPESALINSQFKGKKTQAIINRMYKAWNRAKALLAKRVAKEGLPGAVDEQTSHSLLQAVLIKTLAEIFDVNADSKVNLTKKKQSFILIKNTYKKLKSTKIPAFRAKTIFVPRRKSTRSKSYNTRQTTQNIVPLINAELKRYVIEEMSYPSLENRSGRFAGSVRVLSAQENAAVQYTYQKSPYQVFSPARGKRPWATEERDPAKIIDRAIKRIGQDRFQKVFRTEER